jgi:L-fuculose-phosphate aldolase
MNELRNKIIEVGRLLWDKDLISGLNGNISLKVDADHILMTATKTCLGFLKLEDILLISLDPGDQTPGVSTEKTLHTSLYRAFDQVQAVVHTHTPFINGYFLERDTFTSRIFEAKIALGEVRSVEQLTPSVTDVAPVIAMMRQNNVGVLRNHGVLAMGENLFDCFLAIQSLEEAIKIECVSLLYQTDASQGAGRGSSTHSGASPEAEASSPDGGATDGTQAYELFSPEQMQAIVDVVNQDATLRALGEKTDMTMDLAVKNQETGQTFRFRFDKGRITDVGNDADAEFVITAPEKIWRAVFKREIDPFVATTQKKMHLQGDFGKISKWYAPCSRIFEIWTQVPVKEEA